MRHETMTCETFTESLGAMLEGDLDPAQQAAADAHAAGCAECASLRSDLLRISAEASQLPELTPSRDLWAGVAARVEPKVLPLATPVVMAAPRRRFARQALMAAGLVFVTAGVTWFATNQANERALARQVAGTGTAVTPDTLGAPASGIDGLAAADPRSGGARPTVPSPTSELGSAPETQLAVASDPQRPVTTTRPRPTGERRAAGGTATLASETVPAAARAVEEVYGSEIQRLHDIVAQRKTELDPATVKVIEDNLAIIDSAIVQSRRAIARDPNSGFLMEQLNSVLDRKVGLLRTAAMLPARS